jgi:hypothetical protein
MRLTLLCLLFACPLWAQDLKVTLEVENAQVTMGEALMAEVNVEGGANPGEPQFKNADNFEIQGRGTSMRTQIINGAVTTSRGHTFVVFPKKEGKYTLGPAEVEWNGKSYQSNSVEITVLKDSSASNSSGTVQSSAGRRATPPGTDKNNETDNAQNTKAYRLEATVDNQAPFVGAPIIYTLKILTRVQINNGQVDVPDFKGFWKENIVEQKKSQQIINGEAWQVIEWQYLLLANNPGPLTIEGAKLVGEVMIPTRRRPFGGFFDDGFFGNVFGEPRPIRLASNPITMNVQALPPAPPGFNGLVGRFNLKANLGQNTVKRGESVTLTVELSGEGNFPEAKIVLPESTAYKFYEDKPEINRTVVNGKLTGQKIFKWAVVSLQEGNLNLGPLEVVYFDPEEKNYKTTKTPAFSLKVNPGEEGQDLKFFQGGAVPEAQKKQVQVVGQDLMPILFNSSALEGTRVPSILKLLLGALLFYLLAGIPILLWWRRRQLSGALNWKENLRSGAFRQFRKSVSKVSPERDFCEQLAGILQRYLSERFALDGKNITSFDLPRIFPSTQDSSLVGAWGQLLNRLDSGRFGGKDLSPTEKKELYAQAETLVEKLEKILD